VKKLIFFALFLAEAHMLAGQGFTRQTYHDRAKNNLKEVYQVKDTIRNILHGRYISYYLNGNIESRGQFTNNETTGVWEFYYETGKLKMRGILKQNANFGLWEYFYESGQKSMQGNVNGKNREGEWISYYENGQVKEQGEYSSNKRHGLWKTYFEDGVLKGEIDYTHDSGRYTEYYHSGKIYAEGPKAGTAKVGKWRYFGEDGLIQAEGHYDNGKKQGEWVRYYPDGKVSSRGTYLNDAFSGLWEHFYENGKQSESGSYANGLKSGEWKTFFPDGSLNSKTFFHEGRGEYREFYPSGKLKAKGTAAGEQREGKWEFYYEDGRKEGECVFKDNRGVYYGYYPNGTLQTKGPMEGALKTGTWEIYQEDGKLSGYYRPFYDNKKLSDEIVALAGTQSRPKKIVRRGKKLTNFDPRVNEFRGLIVGGNPLMVFAGQLPLAVEFYLQERLGHEFEFTGIRNPFFKDDLSVPVGDKFERGYAICIKQKLYQPMKIGMWYFGHEIRFTNFGHFINQPISVMQSDLFTFSAVEQRIEWGLLLGYRISKSNVGDGLTIDAFISADAGYRGFDVDPKYAAYFKHVNQSKFATSFHFGLNFGNVFSFR
jgi:antitoxin component YwqK of YwqJK toxin-antitoxin module